MASGRRLRPRQANNTFESVSARVGDVEDILSTYSMDEIDLTSATYSMLDDLMKSTGDPYAAYYNPDLYNTYIKRPTERSYAGIGVVFADYNGRAYVSDVFEGSEAEAKGVQQGDFLTSIDSEDVSAWSMTEVVNALAKDEGATVSVTWMRPGEPGTPRPASSSPRRSPARSTRRRTSPPRFPTAWAS